MRVVVHILWRAQELGCVIILVVVITDGLGCNIVGCVLILADACMAGGCFCN